ncbi:hypothetical protein BURCENBC7_AP2318 [Burkholderia cenocepacia BC7]|jgi:hypothetical protein|nr:hypothetical protein BURCENK562V_C4009 [Burkholderia cenocepacia K56-2Valvano]ERI30008.1 hypothetical protein BURCENBC7_AP2318 [Burkholderia cenocepacia BC7]
MRVRARRAASAADRMNAKVLLMGSRCDAECAHSIEMRHVFFRETRLSTIRFVWPGRIDIVRYSQYRPKHDPLASPNRDRPAYH